MSKPESQVKPPKSLASKFSSEFMAALKAELRELAEEQLNKITTRGKKIGRLLSGLGRIQRRYQSEQSILNRMIDGYNNLSWPLKAGLGVIFVAVATMTGAVAFQGVFFMMALTAAASFISYVVFAGLLTQHGIKARSAEVLLEKDILALEESMKKSVEKMSQTEDDFQKIFSELAQKKLEFINKIEELEKKTAELSGHNASLSLTIDELKTINERLKCDMAELEKNLAETDSELKKLSQSTLSFNETASGLKKAEISLLEDAKKLTHVSQEHEIIKNQFRALNKDFEDTMTGLKNKAENDAIRRETLLDKLDKSVGETMATYVKTEEVIAKTDEFLDKFEQRMKERRARNADREAEFKLLMEPLEKQESSFTFFKMNGSKPDFQADQKKSSFNGSFNC